jgi:hypothetical protein
MADQEGAEKKELTRDQLLQYIKKLKVKNKELETQVKDLQGAHSALQADHVALEEQVGTLGKASKHD